MQMINGYAGKKTTCITTTSFTLLFFWQKNQKTTKKQQSLQLAKVLSGLLKLMSSKKTEVLGRGIRREQDICWLVKNYKRDGRGRIVQELSGMGSSTIGGKGTLQKDESWLWEGLEVCQSGR